MRRGAAKWSFSDPWTAEQQSGAVEKLRTAARHSRADTAIVAVVRNVRGAVASGRAVTSVYQGAGQERTDAITRIAAGTGLVEPFHAELRVDETPCNAFAYDPDAGINPYWGPLACQSPGATLKLPCPNNPNF